MGWCSGTQIFDAFCGIMFEPENTDFNEILKQFIAELENMDWDCHQDSAYWDKPVVQKAMRELHPSWFEDDET